MFNGNSRKLYFRGLGQTGNTQTGEIYLDAYGGTNGEILELRSGGGVRLGATGIDGTIQVYNFASNYPIIQSVQSGGLGLNVNSTTSGFTFTQGYTQTTGDLFSIYNSGPTKVFSILASNGNVGIGLTGTTSPTAKLHINNTTSGNTFLAEDDTNPDSSPFVIDHPTKQSKKLQYGVLEGPEHSVYVRGRLVNSNIITLPDYWHALVYEDTTTVNLTPIGKHQNLWVETVSDTSITVGSENEINCFYTVFAERKDIEKLITEFDKE